MADPLPTLIKLAQQKIDNLRHDMNIYLEKQDSLQHEMDSLAQNLKHEQSACPSDVHALHALASYQRHVEMTKRRNTAAIVALEPEIQKLNDKLVELFAERKRYEILLKNKQAKAEKLAKKRETEMLDELGLTLYQREQEEQASETN